MTPPMPSAEKYVEGWSRLHGGYEPSRIVCGYLRVMYVVARPFVPVPSNTYSTAAGLVVSCVTLVPAYADGTWALLAAAVVLVSGAADGLDGAVAVLTGKATRWGYVLDSVADRVADVVYLAALWLLGAPVWICVTAGVALFLLEYTRARAGAAGMREVGVVTVGERGTRIVVTIVFLVCGAILGPVWFGLGAAAVAGLSLTGLAQLLVVVRRRLYPVGPDVRS